MDDLTLPPDLERFAAEAVAAGRYRDMGELFAAGVSLLQRQEQSRSAFVTSLDEAIAEGERDGFFSIDDVEREMEQVIAEVVSARK
jgi:putative addiction module CopG family antidote